MRKKKHAQRKRKASMSYFPTENSRASLDCLEGQCKVAGNFGVEKQKNIKDAPVYRKKSLKSYLHHWCSLSTDMNKPGSRIQ